MSGTNLASINIIGHIYIHFRPVDGSLGQVSHLFYSSVITMQVAEFSLIEVRGYTHSVSFQQYSILYGQLISGIPEMVSYLGNLLDSYWPAMQG